MEQFSGALFYQIATHIRGAYDHYRSPDGTGILHLPSRPIHLEEKADLWRMYDTLEAHCKSAGLLSSAKCAQRLKQEMGEEGDTPAASEEKLVSPVPDVIQSTHVAYRIEELNNRIKEEMQAKLFIHIQPLRVKYFSDLDEIYPDEAEELKEILGQEVMDVREQITNFNDATFDWMEAGNCFACERFSACVHHLVMSVEFGLVALASHAGVEEKDRRNWNTALNLAHKNLRDKVGNFSNLSKDDEQYFSEAIGLLRNFNVAWRNPSSHIPVIFNETQAKNLFAVAGNTLVHLNRKLKYEVIQSSSPVTAPSA